MKKAAVLLLHFGYWLMYLLLLAVIFAVAGIQRGQPPSLSNVLSLYPLVSLCLIPNLFSFYTSYCFLFPKFLFRQRILALIACGASICLISALSGSLISIVVFGFDQPIFADAREFVRLISILFALAAIHGLIALIIRGFVNWYDELKLKEELAQKSYEMELALVRAHLNPHFLFNTINNIDVLIAREAAQASEYLNKLSGILRYLLYEAKAEKISLDEELKYVEKYLELQRIRTANQSYVTYEVVGEARDRKIAPMIFFPFIENAFKHTENNRTSNSIDIEIVIEQARLNFKCQNTYRNNSGLKQEFGGLGNELIARRLMLLYPGQHTLELTEADGIYRVELSLTLHGN